MQNIEAPKGAFFSLKAVEAIILERNSFTFESACYLRIYYLPRVWVFSCGQSITFEASI